MSGTVYRLCEEFPTAVPCRSQGGSCWSCARTPGPRGGGALGRPAAGGGRQGGGGRGQPAAHVGRGRRRMYTCVGAVGAQYGVSGLRASASRVWV